MKRIAILTDGSSPVSDRMMESLNRGSRYSVGKVPADLAAGDAEALAEALRGEGVDFLLIEGWSGVLPEAFPIPGMVVGEEDFVTATRRLMEACPDYGPERKWAEALGESFDEKRTVPPPMPEEAPASVQQPPVMPRPDFVQPQYAATPQQPAYPASGQFADKGPMPDTYLLWSILATVFCSFIPGIVAIVFSTSVSSRYYAGNMEGARKASRLAQIWIIVSIVVSCITNTLYMPLMLVSGLGS